MIKIRNRVFAYGVVVSERRYTKWMYPLGDQFDMQKTVSWGVIYSNLGEE